jgi:NAD dependent epimerase/dehydratase family enzyme
MSWVHVDDYVAMVLRLLHDDQMRGPFNMTAPQPVTNAEFTRTLARTLHRPAFFIAPGMVLRLAMGERAALMLEGQRVLPAKLAAAGWQFKFPRLGSALDDLLGR